MTSIKSSTDSTADDDNSLVEEEEKNHSASSDLLLSEFSHYTSVFDYNDVDATSGAEKNDFLQECYGRGKNIREDFRAHLSGHFLGTCSGDKGEHSFDRFK